MQNLMFPSGLSVQRAKNRAKQLVKTKEAKTQTEALDAIAFKEMNKPWALAIAYIQQNLLHQKHLITLEDIKHVMDQEPLLTINGFGLQDRYTDRYYQRHAGCETREKYLLQFKESRERLSTALDQCQRCCLYLQHVQKLQTQRNGLGSYSLKHSVERYISKLNPNQDPYVSNGAFICAALHMGIPLSRKDTESPNAWIHISKRSDIVLWERLLEDQKSFYHQSPRKQKLLIELQSKIGL